MNKNLQPEDINKIPVSSIYYGEMVRPELPGVNCQENVYVKTRDGINLAVDIYRPEKEGRYPALFSMCPYLKELQQLHPGLSHSIEAGATAFYVPKGYIHVICQARGSGMSQGKWEFLGIKEQQDGYDVIEWIAQQPWCDGNVAMIGDSYWAWIQYLVAAQQPPHLKCIVPHDGGTDMYRGAFYKGGIFNKGEFADNWINDTMCQCVWPGPVEGKLTPTNLSAELASHPDDGPYYWERGAWTMVDKIKVPVLFFVPRTPLHSQSQLDFYSRFKGVKRLIVEPEAGSFAHLHFLTNRAVNEQILRWLDYWLKGKDTGIMDEPEVAIYDSGTKDWRYETEYPLKRTQWTKYYCHSESKSFNVKEPQSQFGRLNLELPLNEEPNCYEVPISSELLLEGQPVLAFNSGLLQSDLRIWGPLSVTLFASSSTIATAWFVKLLDIGADNQTKMVSRGILKSAYREVEDSRSRPGQPFHAFRKPELLEPGKIYEFQIEMAPIFHTFKTGHKLCLQVASDDLTYFASLHNLDLQMLPVPAENSIYHDAEHPSHLLLPVIPDAPIIKPVGPPVCNIKWNLRPVNKWTRIPDNWRLT